VIQGREFVHICVPGEWFCSVWLNHFSVMLTSLLAKYVVQASYAYSSNVYCTRHDLARSVIESAKQHRPEYVLWLDDDNLVTTTQAEGLLEDLREHPEIDMVVGWSVIQPDVVEMPAECSCGDQRQGLNHRFSAKELAEFPGLREVTHSGFPVVVMRYDMLEKLGAKAFAPMPDSSPRGFMGEDFAFCTRARAAGFKIFCDTRIQVPHMKLRAIMAGPSMALHVVKEEVAA
jgi:GT2 family glycosyltransferase